MQLGKRFLFTYIDDPQKFEVVTVARSFQSLRELVSKERVVPYLMKAGKDSEASLDRVDEISGVIPLHASDGKRDLFCVGVRAVTEQLQITPPELFREFVARRSTTGKNRASSHQRAPASTQRASSPKAQKLDQRFAKVADIDDDITFGCQEKGTHQSQNIVGSTLHRFPGCLRYHLPREDYRH
eukprot:TRINITY_DN3660_c0_g1_i1.p1 TRINITY_DN3660_c0_g1~~TRINITY_DN3660_c0_g1_i1.p1  ORF type:complete len:184 (-),score=18.62 TRINITY_DN3660_c0_g1_i1:580-1131(-)